MSNAAHPSRNLCYSKMIKAIWPSIVKMPNHLPANASITSSGNTDGTSKLSMNSPFLRPPMLLHLLGDPVTLHAHVSTKNQVFVPRQGRSGPDSMASDGHLGVRSSPTIQRAFCRACNHHRDTVLLELVECVEQRAGYLFQSDRQHS